MSEPLSQSSTRLDEECVCMIPPPRVCPVHRVDRSTGRARATAEAAMSAVDVEFEAFLGGWEAVHDGAFTREQVMASYREWQHRGDPEFWRASDDEPVGDDELDNEVGRDIRLLIETGRSLRRRCEVLVEALKGFEDDARELRRVVKEIRRTFPASSEGER